MKFNLVFEGGGAKGLAFVGALQEFAAQGYEFGRLLGASAGAVTATLLAAGYTPDEILQLSTQQVINKTTGQAQSYSATFFDEPTFAPTEVKGSFMHRLLTNIDIPFVPNETEAKSNSLLQMLGFAIPVTEEQIMGRVLEWLMGNYWFRHIFSLIERGGLYGGVAFVDWLTEALERKGLGQATFAQMYAKTGVDLTMIASNTTRTEMMALNHRTAPDCPVVMGVRMSISIPFLWQEVTWQPHWGLYRGVDIRGTTIIDGGVLSNFPLRLFISASDDVPLLMGERPKDDNFTLGLLIDEELEVPNSGERKPFPLFQSFPPIVRFNKLVDTMTYASDKKVIEAYKLGVCHLPAKGYGTTEFDMTPERQQAFLEAGRQAMRQFFATFTPPENVDEAMINFGISAAEA